MLLSACTSTTGGGAGTDLHEPDTDSWLEMMVPVHTPEKAFLIDRYEISELAAGDFFPARNQMPKTGITVQEAAAICRDRGKHLCTEFEWKNACLGTTRSRFAYGNAFVPGRCNVNSGAIEVTGRRAECTADSGAHDMLGNVMEWVDQAGRGAAMGGSFRSPDSTDCFTEQFMPSDARSDQIGFRCCAAVGQTRGSKTNDEPAPRKTQTGEVR
ncbi:MAG: SUMF1/EgtB/PvdO family nonheme iron enzyme [Spirochaetia bacterium]|nr:SUMF1/EgtB/PvdO family nonheme iron enzyme [Spirochaetia bacterium]